jgi:hypothetical protein
MSAIDSRDNSRDNNNADHALRTMSAHDFMAFGMRQVAYVKRVSAPDGTAAFVVHAADGTPLSVHEDAPDAVFTARSNDLQTVTLH